MKLFPVLLTLVLSFVIVGTASAATHTSGTNSTNTRVKERASESRLSSNVDVACVGAVVATREASLATGISTLQSSVVSAYSARSSALASAYSKTDQAAVKKEVKTAWDTFKKSARTAKDQWKKTQQSAWKTARASMGSCKAAPQVGDSANASQEVSL